MKTVEFKNDCIIVDGERYEKVKPSLVDGPSEGDLGWRLDLASNPEQLLYRNYADNAVAIGEWFPSEELAKREGNRRVLTARYLAEIKRVNVNAGWVPNWDDTTQKKFYMVWVYSPIRGVDERWASVQQNHLNAYYFGENTRPFLSEFTDSEMKLILTGCE